MSKFIASALSVEMKAFNGSILTKENIRLYGSMSDGYLALTENRKTRSLSRPKKEALEHLTNCNGMPWYNRLKHNTALVENVSQEIDRLSRAELEAEIAILRAKIEER